ncbi:MAG TPA: hypothetical protein VEP73_05405 [Actinomycetota bacterium]|nr:hypothetical protein [Actinomycetota bacterium]
MSFERARKVADAILFEGYVLYPYRASAQKNQARWQFGVLVPRAWSEGGSGEAWSSQTECLVEPGDGAALEVRVRFLQLQARTVEEAVAGGGFRPVASLEVDGAPLAAWDEGVEREAGATLPVGELLAGERTVPVELPGGRESEPVRRASGELAGRVVRERWPLSGRISVAAERLDGPYGVVRLRVRVENLTPWAAPGAGRDEAVRHSLAGAHSLLAVDRGGFLSLLDPPEWAGPAAAACANVGTFPVLVGEPGQRDVVLSSPIILYDHPAVAPESPGDLFDATEIDEILTLRTMALTDEEKREARGTDDRAAAIIDRVDAMPAEVLDRLHGAVRYLRDATGPGGAHDRGAPVPGADGPPSSTPWWDPGADASVSPGTDSVRVSGVEVARGSLVRLRPGRRRADAQDMFLEGRVATVEAVLHDVDEGRHLAVTLADDPAAAELHRWHGRFLYFSPDEVEPLDAGVSR